MSPDDRRVIDDIGITIAVVMLSSFGAGFLFGWASASAVAGVAP